MGPAVWRVERRAGLTLVHCDALDSVPGVRHAFTARPFDGSTAAARDSLLPAVALGGRRLIAVRQVHGARVVDSSEAIDGPPAADAVLASRAGGAAHVPFVRTADCVPLLLAERDGRAVAAVHSGWRGTAADIAGASVHALARAGCDPARLVAAIGPAIGPCCYPVGSEVLEAVARGCGVSGAAIRSGDRRLDLRAAVAAQLARAGLPPRAVHRAPWCARCSVEPSFHSYRRQGAAAGRALALVGWSSAALA